MSLTNAVDLVEYAFSNANQGEMYIQKAQACSVISLAEALIEIFNSKSKIKTIGIRHGEKMHETLVTSEEMLRAEDIEICIKLNLIQEILIMTIIFLKEKLKKCQILQFQ